MGKLGSEKQLIVMQQMQNNGMSKSDIARHFNLGRQYVQDLLGKYNPKQRYCKACSKPFMPKSAVALCCSKRCSDYYKKYGHRYYTRAEKVVRQVSISDIGDCWEWQGCVQKHSGYGVVGRDYKVYYAHRIIWEIVYGNIPKGLHVLHKCDNQLCCNPYHLYLGTPKNNARDRDTRGRYQTKILTTNQIATIKRTYNSFNDIPALAQSFGVHPRTIYSIVHGNSHADSSREMGRALTYLQASRICDLYSYSNHTYSSLAVMYHVSITTISDALNMRNAYRRLQDKQLGQTL